MIRKIVVASGLFFALSIGFAEAQLARPFTKRPVSQEQYAHAIETSDYDVLNASCAALYDAANKSFGALDVETRFESCPALASYIRQLVVKPCPTSGKPTVARVMPENVIDLTGWRRELREGEQCLYDNNHAIWFASLSCGNFITEKLPVYTAMESSELKRADAAPSGSSSTETTSAQPLTDAARQAAVGMAPATDPPASLAAVGPAPLASPQEKSWMARNRSWLIPVVAAAVGGGIVCAARCGDRTVTQTQEIIIRY